MRSKVLVRQATLGDIADILLVEDEAWPDGLRASREMFESRIQTFPEGTIVAEVDGQIVGVVATEIVDLDDYPNGITWYAITDGGWIRHSHNPAGDTLYGVDLSVSPHAPFGVSNKLMVAEGKVAIRLDLKQIALGGRLPRYHKHQHEMSAEEYFATRRNNRPLDPELHFYTKSGLTAEKLIPNYIDDPESCNYGVLLTWKNPFYHRPLSWLWSWLFREA